AYGGFHHAETSIGDFKIQLAQDAMDALKADPSTCKLRLRFGLNHHSMFVCDAQFSYEVKQVEEGVKKVPQTGEDGQTIEGEFDEGKEKKERVLVKRPTTTLTQIGGSLPKGRLQHAHKDAIKLEETQLVQRDEETQHARQL